MGTNEFTTKILPLKNNLFRVVFRITGDVEQSEQIVQEALLKVWEDRDSWIVIEKLPYRIPLHPFLISGIGFPQCQITRYHHAIGR